MVCLYTWHQGQQQSAGCSNQAQDCKGTMCFFCLPEIAKNPKESRKWLSVGFWAQCCQHVPLPLPEGFSKTPLKKQFPAFSGRKESGAAQNTLKPFLHTASVRGGIDCHVTLLHWPFRNRKEDLFFLFCDWHLVHWVPNSQLQDCGVTAIKNSACIALNIDTTLIAKKHC